MWIFDIVPLRPLVDKLHILPRYLRFHCIDHARVELDQERANVLMLSSLFVVKAFADDSFGNVSGENILEIDIQTDDLLPKWVERTHYRLGVFGLTIAVEADHRITVTFHVGWREIFTLIKVKHESVSKLFLVITLNRLVFRSSVGIEIDSAGKIPSDFFRTKEVKRFIALKFIDVWMFVPRTGEDCTGFDSDETHSVVLLLSIAKIDYDIRHLLDVLRKLNFLII